MAVLSSKAWLLVGMPVVSHGLAWTGHFFVEKNAPATFRYPLQGFLANFHMYRLMWAGRGSSAGATESMVIVPPVVPRTIR